MKIINKITNKVNKIIEKNCKKKQMQHVNSKCELDIVEISKKKNHKNIFLKLNDQIGVYVTNLNKTTIKELESVPIKDFWPKAQELICNSYGIPEKLRAPIYITDEQNKSFVVMMYALEQNIVYVSQKFENTLPRYKLFSMLKHEYTHQMQGMQILRTEGIGEQAVELLVNLQLEKSMANFQNTFRNMSDADFEKIAPKLGEHKEKIKMYREAVKHGKQAEELVLKYIKEHDYNVAKQNLESFRQLVINEMGFIPKESREARYSQEIFNSIFSTEDYTSFKTVLIKPHENEAYLATAVCYWEYFLRKFGL